MGASARASALIVVNCAAGATRKVSSYDVFSTRSLLREATFPVSSKKSRPHDLARAYRGAHVHARARVQVASVLIGAIVSAAILDFCPRTISILPIFPEIFLFDRRSSWKNTLISYIWHRIYRFSETIAICNRVGNKVSRALRQTIIRLRGECTGGLRFVFVNFSGQRLDRHILCPHITSQLYTTLRGN